MPKYLGSQRLPFCKTNSLIWLVNKLGSPTIFLIGLVLYCAIPLIFSGIFNAFNTNGNMLVAQAGPYNTADSAITLKDYIFYNFANMLTLEYSTYSPVGIGKLLAVSETILGLALFGALISVFLVKLLYPRKNSIVFSEYCYYALDKECFFIVFVNTNRIPLVQAEMSAVLKTGFTWPLRGSFTAPYIGESVWAFLLTDLAIKKEEISNLVLDSKNDGLKFGISGSYGFTTFASAIKYKLQKVIVVPSRGPWEIDPLLATPEYSNREFRKAFHQRPPNSQHFLEFAEGLGAKIVR